MRCILQILFFIGAAALFGACSSLRNLPEGQSFMHRHDVAVHNAPIEYTVPDDDLLSLSRQKPNRRVLWWRFNHTVYLLVNKKKLEASRAKAAERCVRKNERRLRKGRSRKNECKSWQMFWAETVGEPTVILDSVKVLKSAQQMNVYLQKKGYFNNRVDAEIIYNTDSSKCHVVYNVYPNKPYHLRNITYDIQDAEMATMLPKIKKISVLDSAKVFDLDEMDLQREKMAQFYNNHGYYDFTKDYILYDADSTVGNYQVDIKLILSEPMVPLAEFPDSLVSVPHKKYFIGDIYVHTDWDTSIPNYAPTDTLRHDGLIIVYSGTPNLTKELISCIQGYNTGDLYERDRLDQTYKRYTQLGVLRATTIQITPQPENVFGTHILDTHIRLTPAKKQFFRIEPQVTHRSGNMGIYGNIVYTNRNIFKGAESMDVRIITGMEASQTLVQTGNGTGSNIKGSFGLNTFEIGPEITYRVPRLWPLSCDFTKRSSEPQTALSAAFNYQRRPDYRRTLSQFKFTHNFIENPTKVTRVSIDWVEFSIIKIKKSDDFEKFLDTLKNGFLANSYRDHLILALNGNFTWNTQKATFQKKYFYWRASLSQAGFLLNETMQNIVKAKKDEAGSYEIAGIRYAQYVRAEQDLRLYFKVNEKNGFVWRVYGGIGVPYGNLNVLPFEKSFFSGGSNGMRAWQARSLGPGSSRDSSSVVSYNNIGEIKLEGNVEYRFKMTNMLNFALFADAGNIWLLNPDPDKFGADFTSERFASEIAIGSGIGLRLNFDIFLVRFDLGVKLKDPAKVQGERWLWQPKDEYLSYLLSVNETYTSIPFRSNLVLNLGIGFPF